MKKTLKHALMATAVAVLAGAVPAQSQESDAARKGLEVLKAAYEAAGGAALLKVERIELSAKGDAQTPAGAITIEMKLRSELPDHLRIDTDTPYGSISQGFDGKAGWLVSPQGPMDLPAEMNGEALRGIALNGGIGLLKAAAAGKVQAEFVGETEFNGKKALNVAWQAPSGKVDLFFDAESKLLIGARFKARTMQGEMDEERRWSDFKEVDGVQFAMRSQTYRNGELANDIVISDLKFNTPMGAKVFAKP